MSLPPPSSRLPPIGKNLEEQSSSGLAPSVNREEQTSSGPRKRQEESSRFSEPPPPYGAPKEKTEITSPRIKPKPPTPPPPKPIYYPPPQPINNAVPVGKSRDYLAWSIFNFCFTGCFIGSFLIFLSVKVREFNKYETYRAAKFSKYTLIGNILGTLFGICLWIFIIVYIVAVVLTSTSSG